MAVHRTALAVLAAYACFSASAEEPIESPSPPASAPTQGEKSYAIPIVQIIGFDFLLNRYNRRFSGSSDYDVSWASIKRNLRGPWVEDNDPFKVNQFAHPYQGSLYHGAGRASGLNYWEASALTFAGSALWEIAGEQTPPARNDQIASGIAGSFLGEPLFRMAHLMLKNRSEVPYVWRQWGAAAISPPVGLNRLMFGERFAESFNDHDPIYYGRLRIGANHLVRNDSAAADDVKRNEAELDFSLDYGLPGQPGYTYTRPFDYFSFQAVLSSANGVENLVSRGLLWGTDYSLGKSYRGIWGLYANYDYLAPQTFRVSTTALSIGTTAQWWASQDVAVQGTALVGLGYSAAAASNAPSSDPLTGVANDRDYHYGVAPRLGLALRLIAGAQASLDVNAQKYFLGRVSNRSAGRDDISRIDTALTWRIKGRHAVGVKYAWTHRNASFPSGGQQIRTLGTVGLYYTLLGLDTFGTVDWREQREP